jgi:hypothetical protein
MFEPIRKRIGHARDVRRPTVRSVLTTKPDMRILFTTGYTRNAVANLAANVRAILDRH